MVVDLIVLAAIQILVVLQIVNNAASKDNYSSSISSSSVSVISSASITAISIVTVSTSFISGCSPQSLWSMINQYQLFMLFPMIGVYIPEEVIHFLQGVSFWLFNFSFISLSKLGIYEKFVSFFDWKSNSSYLSSIGFDSVWMIINHLMLVAILFSFIIFHLVILILFKAFKTKSNCWAKLIKYIFMLFTFTIYIRIIIESVLAVLLTSFNEFYIHDLSDGSKVLSFIISAILVLILIIFWIGTYFVAK